MALTARDTATVKAGISLLLESGLTGRSAPVDGRRVPLTRLFAHARDRVTTAHRVAVADERWVSSIRPANRFPRRVS